MITVFGAGSIGCHVGGLLALSGQPVTLVGRAALAGRLAAGYRVAQFDRILRDVPPDAFRVVTSLADAPAPRLVLVCVKSADTEMAAQAILRDAPDVQTVVSLQNGIENPTVLARRLGAARVVPGMVGYNVVEAPDGTFVQTTEGEIILGRVLTEMTAIGALSHDNMTGVQWSKLLMNLNNALNLLSGLPLKAQLEHRGWRRVLAAAVAEGMAVARAERIPLARIGKVHPKVMPPLLRLPDWLFVRIADKMLAIDPSARSSMADDYDKGRAPEVDWLNGHIVARGQALGVPTPVNARITAMVHQAFEDPQRGGVALQPEALVQGA